jgi:hypothetical protein
MTVNALVSVSLRNYKGVTRTQLEASYRTQTIQFAQFQAIHSLETTSNKCTAGTSPVCPHGPRKCVSFYSKIQ